MFLQVWWKSGIGRSSDQNKSYCILEFHLIREFKLGRHVYLYVLKDTKNSQVLANLVDIRNSDHHREQGFIIPAATCTACFSTVKGLK